MDNLGSGELSTSSDNDGESYPNHGANSEANSNSSNTKKDDKKKKEMDWEEHSVMMICRSCNMAWGKDAPCACKCSSFKPEKQTPIDYKKLMMNTEPEKETVKQKSRLVENKEDLNKT